MKFNLWLLISVLAFPTAFADDEVQGESEIKLTLPTTVYAVPGLELSLYFDNIILSQTPEEFQFKVTCDAGLTEATRWTVTPERKEIGRHKLEISVYGKDNQLLAESSTILHVVPDNSGENQKEPVRLLIIGDSLTHATQFPNEIARLLSQPGNPRWEMLGTHKPASAAEGVAHEGYGGWTWQRFVTAYEPNPDGTYRKRSSPFVFPNDKGAPHLDIPRYVEENCDGKAPDYIVILLGINDCFGAPPDDPAGTDLRIDGMFGQADQLLSALRAAAPKAKIGLCLTTPPNSRQEAFQANYKDQYTRWGWKRIQHRLVQRQLEYVAAKQDPQISVVPTELNLDPKDGYPVNNGVHPNEIGYKQIGVTIYSWLKSQLAAN